MTKQRTEISELGEFRLIRHITKNFEPVNSSTILGIGDDAAVIDCKDQLTVVSTDLLIEGIHFDMMYFPLKHLGYKAVAVNLSDIYAMNAKPQQITVSLALSSRFSVEAIEEIYDGIRQACKNYQVDLVGGDTTSSLKGMIISVTAIGTASKEQLTYRGGANPDDILCVSGDLGGAYIGLQLLEREKQIFIENPNIQPKLDKHQYTVGRMLKPEPRADIIKLLGDKNVKPTSMIDISDGLSSELLHLCKASQTGCRIEEEAIPINNATFNTALDFNIDPTTCALNGGEDYELLFTITPSDLDKVKNMLDIAIIGKMTPPQSGARLMSRKGNLHTLIAQGWQAFEEKKQ